MQRGAIDSKQCKVVAIRLPIDLDLAVRAAIRVEDSDFSKFVRNAIRERLLRFGMETELSKR